MSAHKPNRCTGTIARVLGVIARAIAVRIDVEGARIDVHENRTRAQARHAPGRRKERVGRS